MAVTLTNTETQAMIVLRGFLLAVLPIGVEIIRAEINRVPEPKMPDFCILTPSRRMRLSTNVVSYNDGWPSAQTRAATQPTQITIQIDVHGPASADNTQIISTMLRDDYACQMFAATGYDIAPLYASEPMQSPFLNGESQVEWRWVVEAVLQANTVVTTPQEFAAELSADVLDATL